MASWHRVREVFEVVSEAAPEERTRLLDAACRDDTDLRREVEALLHADREAEEAEDRLLAGPIRRIAATWVDDPEGGRGDDWSGREVGPYRLLEPVGRGGMGTVWRAERVEAEFRQTVAVKILHRGLDTEDLLRRFRNERQILAGLDHPSIVGIVDGGATREGLPWFAMELVDGERIDQYCDGRGLSLTQRVRLFSEVCAVVQHAHRNLVVHCDLKPSNILVTREGHVKLLDFGIAKLLGEDLGTRTVAATGAPRPFTPGFASPEQLRGERVTMATDVYSLGIVLSLLLVGRSPFPTEDTGGAGLVDLSLRELPTRPSTLLGQDRGPAEPGAEALARLRGAEVRALRRAVRGDLDAIVLRALRAQPTERYPSPERLGEDLARWSTGLPVLARKGTARYRAGKHLRRHWVSFAVATLLVVTLLGGSLSTHLQAERARLERDRAMRITRFLESVFLAATREGEQRAVTAEDLLDEAVERLDEELGDDARARSQLAETLARVYGQLGRYDKAMPLIDLAWRRRLEIWPPAEYPDGTPELAMTLLHRGALASRLGDYEKAKSLLEETLAMQRRLYGGDHADIAETLAQLSYVAALLVDEEGAESLRRRGLEMRRRLFGDDHPVVGQGWSDLGGALLDLGRCEESEQALLEALRIRRLTSGERSLAYATSLGILARAVFADGRRDEALAIQREVLDLQSTLYPEGHPSLARSRRKLARMLRAVGDLGMAEQEFRDTLEVLGRVLPADHSEIAGTETELAKTLLQEGRADEAEVLLRKALDSCRRKLPPGHGLTAAVEAALGATLVSQGRITEGEEFLVRAEKGSRHVSASRQSRRDTLQYLADLRRQQGRPGEAADLESAISVGGCSEVVTPPVDE